MSVIQKNMSETERIRRLTTLSILTALVFVLQFFGRIPMGMFSLSTVCLPIVIGAVLLGPWAGTWLGLVFGAAVLLSGDAAAFLTINPFGTVLVVLLKGVACGFVSGIVYNALSRVPAFTGKKRFFPVTIAAALCPVTNTAVFLLGCVAFFMEPVSEWAVGFGMSPFVYLMFGMVGLNFVFEFAFNCILSPVVVRLTELVGGKRPPAAE